IRRDPTKPRAIEVINYNSYFSKKELIELPIVGKVTAGEPILAVENIEDTLAISYNLVDIENKDAFVLTIKGDSMINVGIFDGDYVIVKEQTSAQNGDIIVALLE